MIKHFVHNYVKKYGTYTLPDEKVHIFLSAFLALFLILTALLKFIAPSPVINASRQLFPRAGETIYISIGSVLPVVEFGLGILLLFKLWYKKALRATVVLFSMFFAVSVYGQATGVHADCGCFGNVITSSFGWGMMARNALLLGGAVFLTHYEHKGGGMHA